MKNKFLKSYLVLFLFLSGFSTVYAKWESDGDLTEYAVASNSELVTTVLINSPYGEEFINTYKTKSYFKGVQLIRCNSRQLFQPCRVLIKD